MEVAIEIPDRQSMRRRIEIGMRRTLRAERIQIGFQMPTLAPRLDKSCDGGLLDRIRIDQRRGGLVRLPPNRTLSDAEVAKNFFVEFVFALEQGLKPAQER